MVRMRNNPYNNKSDENQCDNVEPSNTSCENTDTGGDTQTEFVEIPLEKENSNKK